jgi:hypothetical protein
MRENLRAATVPEISRRYGFRMLLTRLSEIWYEHDWRLKEIS